MNRVSWHSPSMVVFLYFLASALIITTCIAEAQSTALNEPLVIVSNIIQSPARIRAGETFNETFILSNVGNDTAISVLLSMNITYPFAPVNSSSTLFAGNVNPSENKSVLGQFAVDKKASVGLYSIPYEIKYRNSTGGSYIQEGTFGVQVFSKPRFYIQETLVNQSSVEIFPGEAFNQKFNLTNVGDDEVKKVQLSIDIPNPFAVIGSTSNFFVGNLIPEESKSVEVKIAVDENALVGVYSLLFTITYEDSTGWPNVQSGKFGVQILGEPRLFVDSIRVDPTSLLPGQDGLMTVRFTNVGSDVALDASLTVFGGSKILTSSFAYIAKLDSKQSQSVLFPVSVANNIEPGTYLLNITINYRDNTNNTYKLSKLFELGVLQTTPFVPYFYLGLAAGIAILALVGYLLYTWKPSPSEESASKVSNLWSSRNTEREFFRFLRHLKLRILGEFKFELSL